MHAAIGPRRVTLPPRADRDLAVIRWLSTRVGGYRPPTVTSEDQTGRAQDDPFGDPRLVQLYDRDNPALRDHDFFRALADRIGASVIADVGCGTGLLTVTLAAPGRRVIGVDPSEAMIDFARKRPDSEQVQWIHGDAGDLAAELGPAAVDLAVMTGNVAQHITGGDWPATLTAIGRVLRPGGVVAFESRNPAARAWERWNEAATRGTRDTEFGRLTEWLEVTEISDGLVTFAGHNVFEDTGEHLVLSSRLAFRSLDQLRADLAEAGIEIETVDGGWSGEELTEQSEIFVITGRRR